MKKDMPISNFLQKCKLSFMIEENKSVGAFVLIHDLSGVLDHRKYFINFHILSFIIFFS